MGYIRCLYIEKSNYIMLNQGDSLLRGSGRGGMTRGRPRGGHSVATAAGNIVRIREKPVNVNFEVLDVITFP